MGQGYAVSYIKLFDTAVNRLYINSLPAHNSLTKEGRAANLVFYKSYGVAAS